MKSRKSPNRQPDPKLSRRQEEIRNILIRRGEASITEIMEQMADSPTDGAVRRMLNILVEKGVVQFRPDGARKIYRLRIDEQRARSAALEHLVDTFFAGSAARLMAALLTDKDTKLTADERASLRELIEKAERSGR